MRWTLLLFVGLMTSVASVGVAGESGSFSITKFGAVGDSATNCTAAIQSAVDACCEEGGGIVRVPAGVFMTGTIVLKDNVVLDLEPGSELRAIADIRQFPVKKPSVPSNFHAFFQQSLVYAEGVENIGITGTGTVNGQGQAEAFRQTTRKKPERYQNRPTLIRLVDCQRVAIENVTLRNSAFWTLHLMACRDVRVHGVLLRSRTANYNNDGIDVDGCENVRISDCDIDSLDDAISIKATGDRPCRNVMIDNCLLSSACNAVRVGAENFAGFEDIHFANCCIHRSNNGITFQNIDGFPMKRITFRGISLYEVATPIYVITGRKSYPIGVPEEEFPCPPEEQPAAISDLVFDGITGDRIGFYRGAGVGHAITEHNFRNAIILSGHPAAPLTRCVLRNVSLRLTGGGTRDEAEKRMPEVNDQPNANVESTPVYGIMARYADNLLVSDVQFTHAKPDLRPAVAVENSSSTVLRGLHLETESDLPLIQYHGGQRPYVVDSVAFDGAGSLREIREKEQRFSSFP